MRAFPLLLCCALLAGCMRNASSLPTTVPNGPAWQAQDSNLPSATKPRFTNLYNFRGLADGGSPISVSATTNGALYGTVWMGGAYGNGGVFEINPSGVERIIYSTDAPFRKLFGLVALDGKLYGLSRGAFFEVSLSGEARILHRFRGADPGNFDPKWEGLIVMNHRMYGMSGGGGSSSKYCSTVGFHGCGAVFELSKSGAVRVLYRFNGRFDGFEPDGTLVAFDGKLYGTTGGGGISGGYSGEGTVFEVSLTGKERVLYRFKREPDANLPIGNLVVLNGKLYGASIEGGKYKNGAIFEVSMSGKERVIKSFRSRSEVGNFVTGLTLLRGKIYGTTGFGGLGDGGAIFEIATSGQVPALHYFKRDSSPVGRLVVLGGKLYGATENGGLPGCSYRPPGNCGTVFELSL
jgi:uncharacterized repeat protein (TIGR03803 family)